MACATPSLAPDANWMIPSNFVLTPALRPQADPDYSPLIKSSTSEKPIDTQQQSDQSARHALPVNKTDASPSPFNIFHHFQSIFKLPHGPPYLRFLDGLRVLSMIWVHLGHAFIFYLGFLPGIHAHKNAESVRGSLSHHFVLGGTFAVDTFFFLSGLLAAYQVSKALRKLNSFKSRLAAVTAICLQRYVRLIGLVLVILVFTMVQDPSWVDDPFQKRMVEFGVNGRHGSCGRYWWAVPLLITNFSEGAAECVGWIWYLSNDWQFFLIGMSLLLVYTWNRDAGIISSVSILIMSLVTSVYVVFKYNVPATIDAFGFSGAESFQHDLRETVLLVNEMPDNGYFFHFYINPLVRIQAYIIGLLFGLYLAKKEREGEFIKSGPSVICKAPQTPTLIVTRTKEVQSELSTLSLSPSLTADFSLTRPHNASLTRVRNVSLTRSCNSSTTGSSSANECNADSKLSTRDSSLTHCQSEARSTVHPQSISGSENISLPNDLDDDDTSCMSPLLRQAMRSPKLSSMSPQEMLSKAATTPATTLPCSSSQATKSSSHRRRSSLSHLTLPATPSLTFNTNHCALVSESSGQKLCEMKFHWSCEACVYLLSVALICLPYYANTRHSLWTPLVNLFYVAWSRCLWSISIAGLSYLAVSNNLILNHFLSSTVWIPLSKLSYAFYLMHPIVLSGIYASHRLHLPRLLSWDVFAFYFFMTLLLTLVVATLIYVFIETPLKLIGYRILKKCLSPLEKTVHQSKKVD